MPPLSRGLWCPLLLAALASCAAPPNPELGVKVVGPGSGRASARPAPASRAPASPLGEEPTSTGPRGGVVGGLVRWPAGAEAPAKLKASLFDASSQLLAEWEAEGEALAQGQGSFSFPALPQGRYRLRLLASGPAGATLAEREEALEVKAGDASFLDLNLALPAGPASPPLAGRPSPAVGQAPPTSAPAALPPQGIGIVVLRPSLPPGWALPSPRPSLAPSPAASVAPAFSAAPSLAPSPAASPSLAPSPAASLAPSPSPAFSTAPTPRPSVAPSPTPTPQPSLGPSPTPQPSPSPAPTPTPRPSLAPSPTPQPSPSAAAPDFQALVAQGLARDALGWGLSLQAGTRLAQLSAGTRQALTQGVQAQGTDLARIMLVKAALVGEQGPAIQGLSAALQGRSEGEVAALCLMRGAQDLIQQWADSCGPAIVQTMQGEANPVRALALHQEPSHTVAPFGACAQLAAEQKRWLEAHGGVAVPRGQAGGVGIGITALLNTEAQPFTEARYAFEGSEDQGAFDRLAGHLDRGVDVPIRIAFGSGAGHFMVALNQRGQAPSREALIHDPYTGSTAWVAESAMRQANFRPFFTETARWTHLYAPSDGADLVFFRLR